MLNWFWEKKQQPDFPLDTGVPTGHYASTNLRFNLPKH